MRESRKAGPGSLGRVFTSLGLAFLVCGCGARAGVHPFAEAESPADATMEGEAGPDGVAPTPCDSDADGWMSIACGGDDCEDTDARVSPAAHDLNARPGVSFLGGRVSIAAVGDARPPVRITVSEAGAAYIAWAVDTASYATNVAGDFAEIRVGESARSIADIAVTGLGDVHLSHRGIDALHYVNIPSGGAGSATVVSVDVRSGGGSSIAADGEQVYITYETPDGLALAEGGISGFESRVLEREAGGVTSTAWAGGQLHIAYARIEDSDPTETRYGRLRGDSFESERVSTGSARIFGLALGPDMAPHIIWSSVTEIGYATRVGGRWAHVPLESSGYTWSVGVGVGDDALARLVVQDLAVRHGVRAGDEFLFERLDSAYSTDLFVDRAGVSHVAYTRFRFDEGTEVWYTTNRVILPDGVDSNCDGVDGVDLDGDGRASRFTGGTDDDDTDPSR